MEMMKVFGWPNTVLAEAAWTGYNDGMGQRGYIKVWVDDDLRFGNREDDEGDGPMAPLYHWLIANGAEHGDTVLVNYDW